MNPIPPSLYEFVCGCVCVCVDLFLENFGGDVFILACHTGFNVEHQTREMDAQRECLI